MRMFLLALSFTAVAFAADNRPRIRAVTAFIEVDQTDYGSKIEDAQKFLASAKGAFNRGGFEGAGGRITTQPFPMYIKGMPTEDALAPVRKMREAASKQRNGLNIGPAMTGDQDDTAPVSLLGAC
jgi:hypothetical protein